MKHSFDGQNTLSKMVSSMSFCVLRCSV